MLTYLPNVKSGDGIVVYMSLTGGGPAIGLEASDFTVYYNANKNDVFTQAQSLSTYELGYGIYSLYIADEWEGTPIMEQSVYLSLHVTATGCTETDYFVKIDKVSMDDVGEYLDISLETCNFMRMFFGNCVPMGVDGVLTKISDTEYSFVADNPSAFANTAIYGNTYEPVGIKGISGGEWEALFVAMAKTDDKTLTLRTRAVARGTIPGSDPAAMTAPVWPLDVLNPKFADIKTAADSAATAAQSAMESTSPLANMIVSNQFTEEALANTPQQQSAQGISKQDVADALLMAPTHGTSVAAGSQAAYLSYIKSKVDTGRIITRDMVNCGNITLFSGADHEEPHTITLTFTDNNVSLSGATAELRVIAKDDYNKGQRTGRAIATCTLTQDGDQVSAIFKPSREDCAGLLPGNWIYYYQVVPLAGVGKTLVPLGHGSLTAWPIIER